MASKDQSGLYLVNKAFMDSLYEYLGDRKSKDVEQFREAIRKTPSLEEYNAGLKQERAQAAADRKHAKAKAKKK
mgnify:CR=1 FL=1